MNSQSLYDHLDLGRAVLNAEQLQLRLLTTQRIASFVDVSMEKIMGFGGNNGRFYGNGGRACCIVDQMGIKSGKFHKNYALMLLPPGLCYKIKTYLE